MRFIRMSPFKCKKGGNYSKRLKVRGHKMLCSIDPVQVHHTASFYTWLCDWSIQGANITSWTYKLLHVHCFNVYYKATQGFSLFLMFPVFFSHPVSKSIEDWKVQGLNWFKVVIFIIGRLVIKKSNNAGLKHAKTQFDHLCLHVDGKPKERSSIKTAGLTSNNIHHI